jgi:dTDP-4-dehydrorhamnose reductase
MKIMVIGHGWTGEKMNFELSNRGHDVQIYSHNTGIFALSQGWDWVVNCAGVTGFPNVDACESNKIETIEGNALFPLQLAEECQLENIKLAHFSSGCIYQGNINNEMADPNFFGSIYSITKGISDKELKHKALVFRIRMPFTGENESKNYLTKVLKYAQTAKLIDAGDNSLTDHNEAVQVACDLIEEGETGPWNLVNRGVINMHELAEMLGVKPEWFTPEEFAKATAAARSTCTIPSTTRMRPVRDALEYAIKRIKNT